MYKKIVSAFALVGFGLIPFAVTAEEHHHHHEDYSAQFAAASPSEDLSVEQCWVRLLPSHLPSAGYFVIQNEGNEEVNLIAATSPSYEKVMLHETVDEDGLMKMKMADKMVVSAQSTLEFKPEGLHAMYEQPTGELNVGDNMSMELLFSGEQKVNVTCKVKDAKSKAFN